jgi:molybdopterin/thiamine biosynthesis adenylyltransferase
MDTERYDRSIRFFGKEGQERLAVAKVAIVGIGGLGMHVVQQLALFGVGQLILIEPEELDRSNFNRYPGVHYDDPVPGTLKTEVATRMVKLIDPRINVIQIAEPLVSQAAFDSIITSGYVFGCLDEDGSRLILNELCSAYSKPYIDLASDILLGSPPTYGGRVCVDWDGHGCVACYGEIDVTEAQTGLMNQKARADRNTIYGVPRDLLGEAGPSVVSINGVIASLAVTEFMLLVTGIREKPKRLMTYYGNLGCVTVRIEEPASDCYYCSYLRGKGDAADVQRYLKANGL